jgi:AcrR family transcriptional regulator
MWVSKQQTLSPRRSTIIETGGTERNNAAGLATKSLIIDVAEKLFADRGIDGVNFTTIRTATGLANKWVTQYHFGDKASLVRAILDTRYAQIDRERSVILDDIIASGKIGDVRALLEALFRPKIYMVDKDDFNTFSKFVLEIKLRYADAIESRHPLYEETGVVISTHISNYLKSAIPGVSFAEATFRVRGLMNLLDAALVERDALRKRGEPVSPRETVLQWALEMGQAALLAPPAVLGR